MCFSVVQSILTFCRLAGTNILIAFVDCVVLPAYAGLIPLRAGGVPACSDRSTLKLFAFQLFHLDHKPSNAVDLNRIFPAKS